MLSLNLSGRGFCSATIIFPYQMKHFPLQMKGNLRRYSISVARLEPYEKSFRSFVCNEKSTSNSSIEHYVDHKPEDVQPPSAHPVYVLAGILEELKAVRRCLLASENRDLCRLNLCHRNYLDSAMNLCHHLALKCLDLQRLNEDLCSVGLQSLESIDPSVLPCIDTIIQLLELSVGTTTAGEEGRNERAAAASAMRERAFSHATALFGPYQDSGQVHVMVTAGKEAISNETLIADLLKAGADVIRINCAHDDPTVWSEIVRIARQSSASLGKSCRVLMDLAGPKLRTASLLVNKIAAVVSPESDDSGDTLSPARIWLCCDGRSPPSNESCHAILRIGQELFGELRVGDTVSFVDPTGGRRPVMVVEKYCRSGYVAECSEAAHISLGGTLHVDKEDKKVSGQILKILTVERYITVETGDVLTLTRSCCVAENDLHDDRHDSTMITCSSDHIFNSVKPGEPIAFDDGKIWGMIQAKNSNAIVVMIVQANAMGSKLGTKKSINLPKSDTKLLRGLTSKDLVDLHFVAANADIVGISFIRDANDMASVQRELEKRNVPALGLMLKIETREAVDNLPQLLLQAMQSSNPIGVMIARGDLMVECGWDQLGEIQKEIMAVCGAAHIPVTWATEVLDILIKSGFPSRAEITDVANAMKASCIMLNKGKHVVDAVAALDSMLCKLTDRRRKKMPPNLPSKSSRL
ncbi:hypothetical protein C4D60_Mb01t27040 [Musa balbisiana]|uniref:pyruvate kinase n=1 Tax=Musa balbisiana TaxID=52838 RepID=A0A4S8JR13_MUSBA|nr:hypothetical protein C4D60_Mb01t27040 [Musa balbisiana]